MPRNMLAGYWLFVARLATVIADVESRSSIVFDHTLQVKKQVAAASGEPEQANGEPEQADGEPEQDDLEKELEAEIEGLGETNDDEDYARQVLQHSLKNQEPSASMSDGSQDARAEAGSSRDPPAHVPEAAQCADDDDKKPVEKVGQEASPALQVYRLFLRGCEEGWIQLCRCFGALENFQYQGDVLRDETQEVAAKWKCGIISWAALECTKSTVVARLHVTCIVGLASLIPSA
eukprot:s7816_g2.t1